MPCFEQEARRVAVRVMARAAGKRDMRFLPE
jgi:hypothetical protein